MEPLLSSLVIFSFGLLFAHFAEFVESQSSTSSPSPPSPFRLPPPPTPTPPAPRALHPPPSPLTRPPPPPARSRPSLSFLPRLSPRHHNNTAHTNSGRLPAPQSHKLNIGKKIGLLFTGIVINLQIGVVGFLVFKRRQLLKIKGSYETCSSSW